MPASLSAHACASHGAHTETVYTVRICGVTQVKWDDDQTVSSVMKADKIVYAQSASSRAATSTPDRHRPASGSQKRASASTPTASVQSLTLHEFLVKLHLEKFEEQLNGLGADETVVREPLPTSIAALALIASSPTRVSLRDNMLFSAITVRPWCIVLTMTCRRT